ncbi:MAG: cytochrome c oxidase subunit II [Haloferacaceae archaeon]
MSGSIVPHGIQEAVFNQMFWVFTGLGILVGTVVIGYLFWNSYRYRAGRAGADDEGVARPELGKLPTSDHGGRHLLISFSISALIVVSLIAWSYGSLLYLTSGVQNNPPAGTTDQMEVTVVGHQFFWEFDYHNVPGHDQALNTSGTLRIPANTRVKFRVTSADVFHTFGIPDLKVKSDAIPGQTTTTWLVARNTGTYLARCYELCGVGHSYMTAKVIVMKPQAFDQWYAQQTSGNGSGSGGSTSAASGNGTATAGGATTATPTATPAATGTPTPTATSTANGSATTATSTANGSMTATATTTGAGA